MKREFRPTGDNYLARFYADFAGVSLSAAFPLPPLRRLRYIPIASYRRRPFSSTRACEKYTTLSSLLDKPGLKLTIEDHMPTASSSFPLGGGVSPNRRKFCLTIGPQFSRSKSTDFLVFRRGC